MNKKLLAFIMAACMTLGLSQGAMAMDNYGTITVDGYAQDTYVANQSMVVATVKTEKANVQEAKAENDQIFTSFRQSLRDMGILDKDIRTTDYRTNDRRHYKDNGDDYMVTYEVSNTVRVTLDDTSKTSAVLAAAAQAGISDVSLSKLDLNPKDKAAQEQALLVQAAKDARQKADALAAALGTRVIGVESLNRNRYDYGNSFRSVKLAVADVAEASPVIENGTDTEDMHVTVVFKVK